jgi:lipoprotein-anchoring transpeptidase ErfK/SrfK
MKILAYAAMAALLFAGTACTNLSQKKPATASTMAAPKPSKHSFWNGDGVSGTPSIQIVLSDQRAYFYKGQQLVGESTISSGKKGFETPPGTYKVIQKDKDHASNLYGDYVDEEGNTVMANVDVSKDKMPDGAVAFVGAKMPFFLRFTGGYGMHAGHLPGYRASHGCVRMPDAMAEHFFTAAEIGTPVTVQP